MDIKIQTKISVLLEKIHYLNLGIQQQGGMVSKVDKDLLTNYVRELYELVLSLPSAAPAYPDPTYMYHAGFPPQAYVPQPEPAPYQSQSPSGFIPPSSAPIGNMPTLQSFRSQQPAAPPPQPAPQPQHQPQPNPQSFSHQGVNGNHAAPREADTRRDETEQPESNNDTAAGTSPLNPAFTMSNGKRTISESIRIKTGAEKPSLNEQFKKEERHIASNMQLTPIKDLKTFIGLNKRFSYINFLFGNDANLYDEAIEKLNGSGTRQAAMDYLDNLLRPRLKWTDDNDMVGEFYQLVERRYL